MTPWRWAVLWLAVFIGALVVASFAAGSLGTMTEGLAR